MKINKNIFSFIQSFSNKDKEIITFVLLQNIKKYNFLNREDKEDLIQNILFEILKYYKNDNNITINIVINKIRFTALNFIKKYYQKYNKEIEKDVIDCDAISKINNNYDFILDNSIKKLLSNKEYKVYKLLEQGYSYREIATKLKISLHKVRYYVAKIKNKTRELLNEKI